jgi:hypothetical protein
LPNGLLNPSSELKKEGYIDTATLGSTGLCIISEKQVDTERELYGKIAELTGIVEKQKSEITQYKNQIQQYNDHKWGQTIFEMGSIVFSSLGTGIIGTSFQDVESFNFMFGCLLTIIAIFLYILSKIYNRL